MAESVEGASTWFTATEGDGNMRMEQGCILAAFSSVCLEVRHFGRLSSQRTVTGKHTVSRH